MLISKKNQFIFIHIKKAAGSSITDSLRRYDDRSLPLKLLNTKLLTRIPFFRSLNPLPHHVSAREVRDYVGPSYSDYFKFTFVRNPFDWQVSNYFFIKQHRVHPRYHEVKDLSYNEYLAWTLEKNRAVPQTHYISDIPGSGELIVDFVGKMENIEDDFRFVLKQIGLEGEVVLPHKNKSKRNTEYRQYYDDEARAFIEDKYRLDLEIFDYAF